MNKFSFLLGLALLATTKTSAQEEFNGSAAARLHEGASWVQKAAYTDVPTFIRLADDQKVPLETFPSYTKKFFQLSNNYGWKTIQTSADELGFIHYRLNQTYNGYPVEGAVYLMHTKDGQIRSLNGQIFNDLSLKTDIVLSETQAFDKALATIGAKKYMWEMDGIAGNAAEWKELAAKPKGELVIVCDEGDFTLNQNFHLAYKFDIYANTPMSRNYVYIDAQTGALIYKANRLHTADTPGTAVTKYSGTRAITTDSYNGAYRLRESGLGGGIRTVNLQTGTNLASFVDFTDTDNNWNNVNAQKDEAATDAHWAAEQTYGFFKNHFNRNGIDGNNDLVRCFMHYDVNYFNAFWDGANMVIGDGNSSNGNKPLSAIDIIGHEMTHGVTQYTANLNYQGESGALNESMSDIMGTTIELEAKPTASWNVGSDIGVVIRSMSNPNQYGDPDTYAGTNWAGTGANDPDNGGVHTNSGVQNYWYYLVAQGGSGTNDNNVAYNITGIGIDKARDIAYRMLSVYLGANSQYADARTAAIQSATDLYGACTNEVQVVTNAWRAVGVGAAFVATVTADFSSPTVTGCQVPFDVQFTNSSTNGGTFSWNFGDGTTSTANSPLHTYTTFGVYNVFLFADGGSCGTDTQLKNAYIDIQSTNPCIVVMNPATNQTQTTCSGTLYDTGGTGNYQDNTDATITIAPAGASTVTLNFQSFNFETDYDYLYIYDGPTTNSPLIGQYDGTTLPGGGTITSTTGSITVRQVTDGGLTMPGFALNWQCFIANSPPTSDFIAQSTTSCDGSIIFVDKTNPTPTAWLWDFGDGTTATQQNPTHTYTANGTYTVQLTATNSFGANTKTRTSYVTINMPNPPTVTPPNPTILSGQTATLNATASGTVNWYNATQNLIATGITYTTPPLTATTTYYVKNIVTAPIISGGPANNTIGSGAAFNNPVRHLKFDVLQNCTLKSVKAYATGGGSRTIEHRDASGNVINDTIVNLVNGTNVITLNFPLTPGTQYQLGVKTSLQNPNLYRNSGGAVFPYNIGTYASITGTDATTAPNNYYFFYDWKIVGEDCESGQVPVTITVEANGISEALANGSLSIYPNPSNGFFTIDIQNTQAENMEVAVFNLLGQQVAQIHNRYTDHLTSEINLSQHAAGTYIVQCKVGEQVVFKKYIKED